MSVELTQENLCGIFKRACRDEDDAARKGSDEWLRRGPWRDAAEIGG